MTARDQELASLGEAIASLAVSRGEGPLIVALDGPVAAGKTTLAARLAAELALSGLSVVTVSADGFLLPMAVLEGAGLVGRKGFPESFDRVAMCAYLTGLREGAAPDAPAYAHENYDVSPDRRQASAGADVVLFEGVNVLQPDLAPLYDYRLYLDTPPGEAEARFTRRFVATPFTPVRTMALAPWRPADGDPAAWAEAVWAAINGPNLEQHIAMGRGMADRIVRV